MFSMFESFINPIADFAANVLGSVAAIINPVEGELKPSPNDGTVNLPQDLFAQPGAQTEWWYYTGHCRSNKGREFGFELVFFKRRTDNDKLGKFPVSFLANPMYFAHFAISDISDKRFRYDHRRSFNRPLELAAKASSISCDVSLGDWSLREVAGKHILHATLPDGLVFDAVLESGKPVAPNGDGGSGLALKSGGSSKHFSFTRMTVSGQLLNGDMLETFTGTAWMDREYGAWEQTGGWDWFSIQFDDETELMIYQFKDASGGMMGESTGTYVDREGRCHYLKRKDFEIATTSTWKSKTTQADYPSGWHVRVPGLDIDITITSLLDDQELDTRGTTMIVYWEGACSVNGKKGITNVTGRAYVELVGYDRSHHSVGVTDFIFGKPLSDYLPF